MFKIGCHLSISDGYLAAAKQASALGANTFQYFSRNPRGGSARKVDEKDITAFNEYLKENNFGKIVAHAPYTLNACSAEPRTRVFARECMQGDLKTMRNFDGFYYNFHPGSHTTLTADEGIGLITAQLNAILSTDYNTTVLLETMSGKGSELGYSFEQLKTIIDGVENNKNLGVLLDTCHIYSAGYDIVNDLDGTLEKFDSVVGMERLKAIHVNDSMTPFDSRKDRHEKLGKGTIGLDAIARIINHDSLKDLVFILETPNELDGYKYEIELLKSLRNDK